MLSPEPTDNPADAGTFAYRILIVDDEAILRTLGTHLLEAQGYQVLSAADGLLALAALKDSLPDIIISDLSMPNMDGFEFLSVVRRRFPLIPVIAISGEFTGISVPASVLADAFFPKGQYKIEELFATIIELLHELPTRPRAGKPSQAAVWAKNDKGTISVSCPDCLRTFPVTQVLKGDNEAECIFCGSVVVFEIIGEPRIILSLETAPADAAALEAAAWAARTGDLLPNLK